ncbi:homocysteine S-methyltransferase [Novosphingobium kunmingense]|uniref:Homocysteine S-methyltransferase n=1 Tax=Novosphingobium kunmingense TaxID=1211806 RepID=A0A2N0I3N7_9SPHN|nr:homocysteine S-methyltransferase family protein [Novosphingobium kunmingense]PKB25797.1 homocysteine S-methyltransferase [Novosphingobium kunmingense]
MGNLPKLGGAPFLTDAGLETCMVFKDGLDLPSFASFVLVDGPGRPNLEAYYRTFLALAEAHGAGFVLDTPSWRANPDWGDALGLDRSQLETVNRNAITMVSDLRAQSPIADRVAVNLVIGPRGDGYRPDALMSMAQAAEYHGWQAKVGADAGIDMLSAVTMNYVEEAQGIAAAAARTATPCVISFTVETDGRLPTGMTLAEAVRRTDDQSGGSVAYYMVNCAHPSHFIAALDDPGLRERIGGIRANASRMSHAELDEAEELDDGDPAELAGDYASLLDALPHVCVLGGCCGTDHRHVAAIADQCVPAIRARQSA